MPRVAISQNIRVKINQVHETFEQQINDPYKTCSGSYKSHGSNASCQTEQCERLFPHAAPPQDRIHHKVAGEHLDARSVREHARRDGGHDALSKKHVCWLGVKPSAWLKSRAGSGRTHVIIVAKDEHPEQDTSRRGNGKETCKDGFEYAQVSEILLLGRR